MLLSGTVVTAMGIVEVERNRLRQLEIEVKALVALAAYGDDGQKHMATRKLEEFAYPELLADVIE